MKEKLRYSRISKMPNGQSDSNKYSTLIAPEKSNDEESKSSSLIVKNFFFGKKKFDSNSKATFTSGEMRQSHVTVMSNSKGKAR